MHMKVTILTPEKALFEGEAKRVKVPGAAGQFEVLDRHAPIVSSLIKGNVVITTMAGEKQTFPISKGFIEVFKNEVAILVRS